jgi:arylsulfatase
MKTRNIFVALSVVSGVVFALAAGAQEVLPKPEPPFKGKIERTAKDSTPDFPKGIEAPKERRTCC